LVKRGVFIEEFEILCKSSVEIVQHRLLRVLQEKHFTQEKGKLSSDELMNSGLFGLKSRSADLLY